MRSFIGVFVVIGIVLMLYFLTKDVEPIEKYSVCVADGRGNIKCEEE